MKAGRLTEHLSGRSPSMSLTAHLLAASGRVGGLSPTMPLVTATDLLEPAARAGRAVGAFNAILLEHAEALVAAGDRAGLPVIIQISENCVKYHGGLAPLALRP